MSARPAPPPPSGSAPVRACAHCGSADVQIVWLPPDIGQASGYAVRCECGHEGPTRAEGKDARIAWNEEAR